MPSGEINKAVTMRYYRYNDQSAFVPTKEQPLRPGPTFRFKASDISQNTLNIKFRNNLPLNEHSHYPQPPYPGTGCHGVVDKPKCFNTTNLHFHGFHVSPMSVNADGKTVSSLDSKVVRSSDDPFVELKPKGEEGSTGEHLYQVVLPVFHAPGTHWYHPHNHGSTALHVVDGMSGALIVEEEGDAVIPVDQDLVWIAQEVLSVNPLVQPDPNLPPVPGDQMIYNCSPSSDQFTINGVYQPKLTMQPGELHRWRFINATASVRGFINIKLVKVGEDGTQIPQDIHQIAADGISFYGKSPQRVQELPLNPGNRADFLIQINEPGTYQVVKDKWQEARGNLGNLGTDIPELMQKGPLKRQVLATVTITGEPVTKLKKIPNKIPGKVPNYLKPITDDQMLREESGQIYVRPVVFGIYETIRTQSCNTYQVVSQTDNSTQTQFYKDILAGKLNPGEANPNPRLFQINGKSFTPKTGDDYISYIPGPETTGNLKSDEVKPYNPGTFIEHDHRNETAQLVKLNTCEEWIIYNYTNVVHPFHIHVCPYQVVEVYNPNVSDTPIKFDPEDAVWYDSYGVPGAKFVVINEQFSAENLRLESVGYIKVRLRFSGYWGKQVFHCHLLNHEDQGMMQNVYMFDDGRGNNPFVQVTTSAELCPGLTIGKPGALPANYYPPSDFIPGDPDGVPQFPPQVQIASDGQIIGIAKA
ncbi:MAG: multicopper oxidase domain-containing protein [Scytonema sp. PMC 1070.18]|nr:multicopper oxidase domain-containing protein [Scytonema sp. PMC 1070.18]